MSASALMYESDQDDGRFRMAMVASGIGTALVDLDGRWLEVNPALERMLGYSATELIGRMAAELVHPDDRDRLRDPLQALRDGRLPALELQQRYLHRNGGTIWAHANVAAVRDGSGRPRYLVEQLRDIGAQRAAEQSLRERNQTLEQRIELRTAALQASNQQLELFAFGVCHDLRMPLRAIDDSAGQLEQRDAGHLDADGQAQLRRIRAAAGQMTGLIDGLLDLSRASRAELRREPVDLSLLADWVGAELQEAEPARLAEIVIQPGLRAIGDERQLKLLLGQLMHNAWKFSRARARVRIEVGGEHDSSGLRLWVRDFGSGFDARHAGQLFEPFQRLHGPEHGGGNGLGLAIARRIVERHGGRLWAESMPGVGSTFQCSLPDAGD